MKKKIIVILMAAVLAISGTALSENNSQLCTFRAEQYHADMPDIYVYMYPTNADGEIIEGYSVTAENIEAYLDDQPLTAENVSTGAVFPIQYVFTVDISGSVGKNFFNNAKEAIRAWIDGMNENDSFVLITIGDDVKTVLNGNESRENAKAIVEELKQEGSNKSTNYFKGLNEAVDKAEKLAQGVRCVVVAVTDGMNTKNSSYDKDDTLARLQNSSLPMYTVGVGRRDNRIELEDLERFTKSTNGAYLEISNSDKNDADKVNNIFGKLNGIIDSCMVVTLKAENNSVSGNELRMKIDCGGKQSTLLISGFEINSWKPDTEAPTVQSIEIKSEYCIEILFSEQVEGAGDPANFKITNSDGKPVSVKSAAYDKASLTTLLTFGEPIYDGEYKISFINITDLSRQHNPLKTDTAGSFVQKDFPTEEPTDEPLPPPRDNMIWLYITIPAVLVLLIAILVIVSVRKKRGRSECDNEDVPETIQEAGQNDLHIPEQTAIGQAKVNLQSINGHNIELEIYEHNGLCRNVTIFVADSCIIGRSTQLADLSIDDARLSRQHCVLSYVKGVMTIADLNSLNGTVLNGVRIGSETRPIQANDIIKIGNTKITVNKC